MKGGRARSLPRETGRAPLPGGPQCWPSTQPGALHTCPGSRRPRLGVCRTPRSTSVCAGRASAPRMAPTASSLHACWVWGLLGHGCTPPPTSPLPAGVPAADSRRVRETRARTHPQATPCLLVGGQHACPFAQRALPFCRIAVKCSPSSCFSTQAISGFLQRQQRAGVGNRTLVSPEARCGHPMAAHSPASQTSRAGPSEDSECNLLHGTVGPAEGGCPGWWPGWLWPHLLRLGPLPEQHV